MSDCGCVASDNSGDDCDDCFGVPNGTAWDSDCGCVPASNSGDDCDDCAGTPNGDAYVDECDTCDSDSSNDCVQDCAGTWGGDLSDDACGICGGDDSSCSDECGVPYGDNSSCADECGVPNGDNSSCADCAGVPNGDAELDECGVCDGPGADVMCWDGSYECNASDCPEEPGDGTSLSFGSVSDGSLEVYLSNDTDVAGFQFWIADTPDLLETISVSTTQRSEGFSLEFNEQADGSVIIVGFNITGGVITQGTGSVMDITYQAATVDTEQTIDLNVIEFYLGDSMGAQIPAFSGRRKRYIVTSRSI